MPDQTDSLKVRYGNMAAFEIIRAHGQYVLRLQVPELDLDRIIAQLLECTRSYFEYRVLAVLN
jgi:hypothetical protein